MSEGSGSDKQEWSATHTRVRIELFLTGIVIFSVHYLGLTLGSAAPFFFQFKSAPSVPWMAAGLYGLFVYFFAAFVLRTFNEGLTKSNIAKDLKGYADDIASRTGELQQLTEFDVPQDRWIGLAEARSSDINLNRELAAEIRDHLMKVKDGSLPAPGSRDSEASKALQLWAVELLAKQKKLNEAGKRIQKDIESTSASALQAIQEELTRTQEAQATQSAAMKASFDELKAKTRTLLRDTSAWRVLLNAEKIWMNVIIPATSSVILASSPLLKLIWPDLSFV